jgi:hypothetical protein
MGVVAGVLEFGPRVGFVSVQQRKQKLRINRFQ